MALRIIPFQQAISYLLPAVLAMALAWFGMDRFAAQNLYPRPDALEYALSASSFYHGEGFVLRLGSDAFYPPRYTPGYPFLLAGWYLITGPHPEKACLFNLLLTGLLTITIVWMTYRVSGSRIGALCSGLLTATSSALVVSSQGVRSDLSGCCFFLAGIFFLFCGPTGVQNGSSSSKKRDHLTALLAGGFLGYAVMIRPSYLFPLAGCLPWVLIGRKEKLLVRGIRLVFCLTGIGLALVPMFILNLANLGNPLDSGYSLWAPDYCLDLHSAYSLDNIWRSFDPIRRPRSNLLVYSDLISGANQWAKTPFYGGAIWISSIVLLAGIRKMPWDQVRFILASLTSILLLAGHYLLFFWQDARFLLLVVPLMAILSGWGMSRILAYRPAFFPAAGLFLTLLLMLGSTVPGLRTLRENLFRENSGHPSFSEIEYLKRIDSRIEKDAVLVSVLDETLCEEYLVRGTGRTHLPLTLPSLGSHLLAVYQYNIPIARFCRSSESRPELLFPLAGMGQDNLSFLKQALQQERAIYVLRHGLDEYIKEMSILRHDFHLDGADPEFFKLQPPGGD
ncbi:MAG: hypothetical protein KJ050_11750 [Candidatus Omnitrophica bacterium]|nr:hypothetical protein [Candidatus Omnitrophota bacterium]